MADSEEIDTSILHPLEHEWTLWYDKRQSEVRRIRGEKESYEANLQEVGTFGTVEDFWRYFNHLAKPSQIANNSNYHLFKKGVKPLWEDANNAQGGKWIINLRAEAKHLLDNIWQNLILSLIGETLEMEDGSKLCGCVCSRRKAADKVAVWNRDMNDKKFILHLGKELKNQLVGLNPPKGGKVTLEYQTHVSAMSTGDSYRNASKYTIPIP